MRLVAEDPSKEIVLTTYASEVGLGFTQAQVKDQFTHIPTAELKEEHLDIVRFGSVSVKTKTLKNASPTMRELAAAIFALKKCYTSLRNKHFTLFTDHQALTWIFNSTHLNPMLFRWIDILMSLDFTVIHWPGNRNVYADSMSRLPIEHNYQLLDPSNPTVQSNVIQNNSDMAANSKLILRNKIEPKTQKEKDDAIFNAHALGHNGSQKIFQALGQQGLWWPSVRNDINSIIGQCLPCQRHAVVKEGFHPIKSIIATYPMDMIQMDLIVGLPKTIEGYCP
jgi:hypothetical protein